MSFQSGWFHCVAVKVHIKRNPELGWLFLYSEAVTLEPLIRKFTNSQENVFCLSLPIQKEILSHVLSLISMNAARETYI